jgi:phosphatidylglycerol:prolipoprotein diacylglycerol transferase
MILATVTYPHIDPFIIHVGPIFLSWYSFMYVVGFVAAYFITRWRIRKKILPLKSEQLATVLIVDCLYGVILGARLFYILFYNLSFYIQHPLEIPAVWHGGMSFHGGLIGCIVAAFWFARRYKISFWHVGDTLALCAPIGLGFGRIGNFINGELYGRVTDAPWGMIFPDGGPLPRHPSQLYESFLEGIVLGTLLWLISRKRPKTGTLSALFLIGYGFMRFIVEFFRQPDLQLGTILGPFSLGQVLCLLMILCGVGIFVWILSKK